MKFLPIWVVELARWLGVTPDSKRPNSGALLILGGFALLAMGYTPDDVGGWGDRLMAMGERLIEFATKLDNIGGFGLLGVGYAMTRGKNGTDLTPEEVAALRAELAALKVRREIAKPAIEMDPAPTAGG